MIEFNLRRIINKYNKYLKVPLTVFSLSLQTGISQDYLLKLMSKHPKSIRFDVLTKLVKFFKLPVSHFFSDINNRITVSISDAKNNYKKDINKIIDINPELKNGLNGYVLQISTIINIKINRSHKRMYYIAIPQKSFISNNYKKSTNKKLNQHTFYILIMPLAKDISLNNRFLYMFENNLNIFLLNYINTRIISHSGLLTLKMMKDKSKIIPIVFSDLSISMSKSSMARPLDKFYLINSIRHQSEGSKEANLLDFTKSYYHK